MSQYQKMQEELARGWNTWNARSVVSHVLLPEGFAINICLREYKAGRYLKESLIGRCQPDTDAKFDYRGGDLVEVVTPGLHAYDGSYTALNLSWREIEVNIQTATIEEELVILVTPVKNQKYPATLVIESGILWNRAGSIEKAGEIIVGNTPNRQIRVYATENSIFDPYIASQTPYISMKMESDIGISTGKKRTVEEIKVIIEKKKQEHLDKKKKYGDLSEVYNAIQSLLAWATVYEPKKQRVITTISRTWDIDRNFGGYLIAQDVFYHGYLASLDNKELAYANIIGMIKEKVKEGFVPFGASGTGWSTLDKSSPPHASTLLNNIYRRYGDKWVLEEVFDDLLSWNRWTPTKRQIRDGLLAWGTHPYESIYDGFFELNSVDELFGAKLESGMDNSTMWDDVNYNKDKHMMELADVGFTSLYIADCEAIAGFADILGKKEEASELRDRAQKFKNGLKTLWDETKGIFLNKHTDTEKFSYRISPSNFYPLLTDVPTKEQAERMLNEHFYNPDEFWGEWIIPSTPRNDKGFKDQYYWRGRIWANVNLLVYFGFRNYGLRNAMKDLAEKSKKLLLKEWLENSHIHENYNADLGIGCDDKMESEKLYTWGGLLGILAFIEEGYLE